MDFSDSEQKVPGSGSEKKKLISSFLSLPFFLGLISTKPISCQNQKPPLIKN